MVQTSFQEESLPPALESGDRLNRYEFERRYNAMHSLQKAELIEGVVYLPAPLRLRSHAEPHVNLTRVYYLASFSYRLSNTHKGSTKWKEEKFLLPLKLTIQSALSINKQFVLRGFY